MALEINRNDAAAREREAMASGGQKAEERLYETVDGKLVREGDPRGAFLKYGPGDPIADRHLKAYGDLDTDKDAVDYVAARDTLAPPDSQHAGKAPVLLGSQQATEIADEARSLAALPDEERAKVLADEDPDEDAVYADKRVWRSEDGTLVAEGDSAGVTQAYAPGDKVPAHDADAYGKVGSTVDSDQAEGQVEGLKAGDKPANKAASVTRTK